MASGMFPRHVPTPQKLRFVRHDFSGLNFSWVPVQQFLYIANLTLVLWQLKAENGGCYRNFPVLSRAHFAVTACFSRQMGMPLHDKLFAVGA